MVTDIIQNATIENLIRLTLQNRDMFRGEYDSGDDWDITSFGNTLDDAIKNIIPEYIRSEITVVSNDIDVVSRIKWNGEYWYNEDHEHPLMKDNLPVKSCIEVIQDIVNHVDYKRIIEENRVRIAKEKAKADAEQKEIDKRCRKAAKKQKRITELAKLAELKIKYPNA